MKHFFTLLFIVISINLSSAQDSEVIVPSFSFEDSLHVDAFVNVVKCYSDNIEYLNVQIFNESDKKRIVGCNILIKDKEGNSQKIQVSPFGIEFMELAASDCNNLSDRKLLFPLSSKIDKKSMAVEFEFNIVE